MKNYKTIVLLAIIFTLIMVSAIHPQVAFADDETPATETAVPTDEAEPQTPVETIDEVVDEESPEQGEELIITAEETDPSVVTMDEVTSEDNSEQGEEQISIPEETNLLTLPDILEQAPENTEIIILNGDGEAEPFASQEAADILTTGDPIWCPDSVTTPEANNYGCTDSWDSFEELLDELKGDTVTFSGPGIIYVSYDYDSSKDTYDVEIDGSVLTTLESLTIQGGWDFGTQALRVGTPVSTLTGVSLTVINWADDVTIKNIFVDSSNYGIEVNTEKKVVFSDVEVANTAASDGIAINAGGDVELTNVTSSLNQYNGATIDSGGKVTIQNSAFSKNKNGPGIEITSPGNVTLSSVVTNNNNGDGITVYGQDVVLQNITSRYNVWDGAYIEGNCAKANIDGGTYSDNSSYGIEISTGEASLNGTTSFSDNSRGAISQDFGDCYPSSNGSKKNAFIYTPSTLLIALPWNTISVIDNNPQELDCNNYIGTVFILENGDRITLPCPIKGNVILNQISTQTLPGLLPNNYRYLSGMEFTVSLGGEFLETLDAPVTLSYNEGSSSSVILYWNGSNWQELSSLSGQVGIVFGSNQQLSWDGNSWTGVLQTGTKYVGQFGHFSSDGYFEAILNFPGIFILAEKIN